MVYSSNYVDYSDIDYPLKAIFKGDKLTTIDPTQKTVDRMQLMNNEFTDTTQRF